MHSGQNIVSNKNVSNISCDCDCYETNVWNSAESNIPSDFQSYDADDEEQSNDFHINVKDREK